MLWSAPRPGAAPEGRHACGLTVQLSQGQDRPPLRPEGAPPTAGVLRSQAVLPLWWVGGIVHVAAAGVNPFLTFSATSESTGKIFKKSFKFSGSAANLSSNRPAFFDEIFGVLPLLDPARCACTLSLHSRSVRTMVARPMRTDFRSGREPFGACRRCSIARSPGFPFPPLALVPNETPAAIPAGVSPCVSGPAPVHAV